MFLVLSGASTAFLVGAAILVSWVFCFFYYEDQIPRKAMVTMIVSGLFSMGWGLLTSKK